MAEKFLVLTDVAAIQSYVFSSVRMAMIVGASQIVREADAKVRQLAKDSGAKPAVASGGIGLFVFDDSKTATAFAKEAEVTFNQLSGNGTLTASRAIAFDDEADRSARESFPKKRDEALESLEHSKRLGTAGSESPQLGLAWICTTCGSEHAVEKHSRPGNEPPWRCCLPCGMKYHKRNSGNERQRRYYVPDEQLSDGGAAFPERLPKDFDELCDGGQWELVAIDGDGLGDRLQAFNSPHAFESFSDEFERLIRKSLEAALQEIYRLCVSSVAPAMVLFDGGDDVLVACRGGLALPFVQAFSQSIQSERNWDWAGGQPIGFSAGVAIVGQGFPFRTAHRIAEGLLRNAKRAARRTRAEGCWAEGAVDYAVVTESFADAETLLDEREIADDRKRVSLQLTGRPYRLAYGAPRSLSRLKETCETLRGFPRSRLSDLRNHLTRSAISSGRADLTAIGTQRIAAELILPFLQTWESRTCRSEGLSRQWRGAVQKFEGFDLSCEFPHADLADAMTLWRVPDDD